MLKNRKHDKEKGISLLALVLSIVIVIITIETIVIIALKNKPNDNIALPDMSQENQEENIYKESTVNAQNEIDNSSNVDIDLEDEIHYDKNGDFLMAIEDVFEITGRGTVVTGRIERGTINLNDTIQIIGLNDEIKSTTVTGIERFRTTLETASAGENVGILLRNVQVNEVKRGQVIAKPNSISPISRFSADIYLLKREEGGRKEKITASDLEQFEYYFRVISVNGRFDTQEEMLNAKQGETTNMSITLSSPIAMEIGMEFDIREDGRTIAKGKVTNIY